MHIKSCFIHKSPKLERTRMLISPTVTYRLWRKSCKHSVPRQRHTSLWFHLHKVLQEAKLVTEGHMYPWLAGRGTEYRRVQGSFEGAWNSWDIDYSAGYLCVPKCNKVYKMDTFTSPKFCFNKVRRKKKKMPTKTLSPWEVSPCSSNHSPIQIFCLRSCSPIWDIPH